MASIPSGVISQWQEMMDAFLGDEFANVGTLVYPVRIEVADNPPTDSIGGKPNNWDSLGRPSPYFGLDGTGPSSGSNKVEKEYTERINMRIYWLTSIQIQRNKQFAEAGISWPTTVIQTKIWATDITKVIRAEYLKFDADERLHAYREYKFTRFGEPILLGFKQNRYALVTWTRAQ